MPVHLKLINILSTSTFIDLELKDFVIYQILLVFILSYFFYCTKSRTKGGSIWRKSKTQYGLCEEPIKFHGIHHAFLV